MTARVDAPPSVSRWRVSSGGHPLVACTADALEVAGTAAVSPVSGPAEPAAFIARDHDRWLADRVGRAKAGRSTVIMLTSDSTAGKKRSLWEAIRLSQADGQLQLAGWTVWPTLSPSDPATLLEAIPDLGPQTIVWLAGAERYFISAAPDVVDAIGKKLRELVTDEARAPILLVGTLKQQHWNTLVAQPRDTASDAYCHIRHVLAGSAIVVPDSFTPSQIQRAAESADPRLTRAARMAPHGNIVQYLAAEPDLKTRLHTSSSVGKAILRCAMEIRGLGHDQWIPSALLKEATGPRLTEREWHNVSDGWFDDAVAELTRTGRGDASPLIRRKIRGDAQNIDQPEYRLHDYFDNRAADTVCAPNPPAQAVWDALLKHAHSRSLLALAREAHRRGLLHMSVSLYLAAADNNGPSCLAEPADALHTAGRIDEAVYCYRRAAECGDDTQIIKAGRVLLWAGRGPEAAELLRDLAQPDDPRVLAVIAAAATSREDQRAAISAYQRAGEQGDSDALAVAASLLAEDGRLDEALRWLVSQSRSGCREALSVAATALVDTRSVEEAVNWLEALVESGHYPALAAGAEVLSDCGRHDDAMSWANSAVEFGVPGAPAVAARCALGGHLLHDALEWALQAAVDGDATMLTAVGAAYQAVGQHQRALECYNNAAEHGDRTALLAAAGLAATCGWLELASRWVERARAAGCEPPLGALLKQITTAVGSAEALAWYRDEADPTGLDSVVAMACLLDSRNVDDAVQWHIRATGARPADAWYWFGQALADAQGDPPPPAWGAGAPGRTERDERLEQAAEWFRRAGEEGNADGFVRAGEILLTLNRKLEIVSMMRPKDRQTDQEPQPHRPTAPASFSHLAIALAQLGSTDEALAILERQIETGDRSAMSSVAAALLAQSRAGELSQSGGPVTYDTEEPAERAEHRRIMREQGVALLQRGVDAGDVSCVATLARHYVGEKRTADAIRQYCRAIAFGAQGARAKLDAFLADTDSLREPELSLRVDTAARLKRYGLAPSGELASEWLLDPAVPGTAGSRR